MGKYGTIVIKFEDNGYESAADKAIPLGGKVAPGGSDAATTAGGGGGAGAGHNNVWSKIAKVWSGAALLREGFGWGMAIVARDNGNSQKAEQYNAIMGIIGKGIAIGGAFAVGGPVAGIAAVAATALGYAKQYEQYDYDKKWEAIALNELRRRAGPSFNRSRLGD
ncbi:MAG: hypothetical protein LBT55_01730 [Clostridiaceae bacterium]|jgi:hypothetical protein|nr:hypothetical protein [Clostridiaceae bacterium]